jgi:hypothetical protein
VVSALQAGDLLAEASQPSTPVNFEAPAGACDCTRIFMAIGSDFSSCGARLHAGNRIAGRNGGAAQGAAHPARCDRDAERLRHG